MKTNSWITADKAKDISSSPTHWLKLYEETVIEYSKGYSSYGADKKFYANADADADADANGIFS